MSFKSQKEIWEHLIAGGQVSNLLGTRVRMGESGTLQSGKPPYYEEWFNDFWSFKYLEEWQIYQEPKPKRKITLYRYTYEFGASCKGVEQSSWLDGTWLDFCSGTSRKFLMTETKEIEIDT